jgi:AdoMet-dependent heme synthase
MAGADWEGLAMIAAPTTRLPALFAEHQAHFDYAEAPRLVYWEATQACALACVHCRASALAQCNPRELHTGEARSLLRQIASFDSLPHLVITGGDPLQRPDLFDLIAYGRSLDLSISVTPAGTQDLTADVIRRFKEAGVASLALSLDGSTPERHDAFRGVDGSYQWTLAGARAIVAEGIPLQINTMVTAQTLDDIPQIYELVRELGITRWALFFLIATGRGSKLAEVSPAEGERLLNWLGQINRAPETPFLIKTTEAHHYRRILAQKMLRHMPEEALLSTPMGRGFGIRDGNGIVFVSHLGQVFPSGFLPLRAGNIRSESLVDIYRHSELFRSLRDSEQLLGKCGDCSFRTICGGSRARAYAATGDPLESDPLCPYQPRAISLAE